MMKKILNTVRAIGLFCLAGTLIVDAATAAQNEAAYTTATRYNLVGQITGVISPRPEIGKPFPAIRNTYNSDGLLQKVEEGNLSAFQSESIAPAQWESAFSVYKITSFIYDDDGKKISETHQVVAAAGNNTNASSVAVIKSIVEYKYDDYARISCVAKRLNGTLGGDACELGTEGGFGSDRITKYDYKPGNFGVVEKEHRAVGTTDEQVYVTNAYNSYGQLTDQTDANANLTHLEYNTLYRLEKIYFPDKLVKNTYNTTDKESYTYDNNGNRKTLTKRDGKIINYDYDALNREVKKTIPTPEDGSQNVYTDYDLFNLKTYARFSSAAGAGITYSYDGFGEIIDEVSNVAGSSYSVHNDYDKHDNRTAVKHSDNQLFSYAYDELDRNTKIFEGAIDSTLLVTNNFDNFSRPQSQTTSGGVATGISYDTLSRVSGIDLVLNSPSYNQRYTFGYNPVGQIAQQDLTNSLYEYKESGGKAGSYTVNNLNQYTGVASQAYGYDNNANLICDGGYVAATNACTATRYAYDVENRLTSVSGTKNATLKYDPAGRLYQVVSGSQTTNFQYNGDQMIAEYSGSSLSKRYVFGLGVDKPVVSYTTNQVGAASRLFLHGNHQGSIALATNSTGNMVYVNTYDEYGVPGSMNQGRFAYTGQTYLPELGMYYYKARIYYPQLGRFLQTDPVGYKDDMDLYSYVGNDPLNKNDPSGLCAEDLCIAEGGAAVGTALVYTGATIGIAAGLCDIGCAKVKSGIENFVHNIFHKSEEAPKSPDIHPNEVTGKTPQEIDKIAKDKGLVPKGADPQNGKGSYTDPETGKQRILVHPDADCGAHCHVNDSDGNRQDQDGNTKDKNGNPYPKDAPEVHLPIRQ